MKTGPIEDYDYALMIWQAILQAHKLKRERLTEAAALNSETFNGATTTAGDFLLGLST